MKVKEAYLKYRSTDIEMDGRNVSSPEEVYQAYRYLRENPVEVVLAIFVNAKNRVICQMTLQTGTVDHSVVYPRELFLRALLVCASGFVLLHCHPSGDPTPSAQDISLTKNVEIAARAMGLRFLDHVVIADDGYFSFQRNGLLS